VTKAALPSSGVGDLSPPHHLPGCWGAASSTALSWEKAKVSFAAQ